MNILLTLQSTNLEIFTSTAWSKLVSLSFDLAKRIIFVLLIWFIGKKIIKILINFTSKSFTKANMDLSLSKFLISLIRFTLHAVLVISIIGAIGIETTSFVTIIGSAGLTLGLSLQGSLSNFAGGVLILLFKPFKVGDYIIACGNEGTVNSIDLLYTKLFTVDNKTITIPNGTLANNNIVNVSSQSERRVDVSIDVSYSTDLKRAKSILTDVINANELVLKDKEITVFVDNLGASSITLSTRCWVSSANYWTVMWSLREDFKYAFDENDINIPFSQMDVHITQ